jgi:hypothetical protein
LVNAKLVVHKNLIINTLLALKHIVGKAANIYIHDNKRII